MLKRFLRNPLFLWLRNEINSAYLEYSNSNVSIGSKCRIKSMSLEGDNYIGSACILEKCKLGRYSYIGDNSVISRTSIGRFCSISRNVMINLGKHPTHLVSTHPSLYAQNPCVKKSFNYNEEIEELGEVEIGNDVWIGSNVLILADIKIGDGSIIASGAIVTRDVEPYSIVGGIPAKVIKKRFKENEIEFLKKIDWWNKSEEWLIQNANHFDNLSGWIEKEAQ